MLIAMDKKILKIPIPAALCFSFNMGSLFFIENYSIYGP